MVTVIDIESALISWLRDDADVAAVFADRVYGVLPAKPTWPALRITRIGGAPPHNRPLTHDRALIQFDAFAASNDPHGKATVSAGIEAVCNAMERAYGLDVGGGIVIGAVQWLSKAYDPDASYTPAAPRYRADVFVTHRRPIFATTRGDTQHTHPQRERDRHNRVSEEGARQ
jgi:hypothetical protein